jgi:type IV secretion system protein VirB6
MSVFVQFEDSLYKPAMDFMAETPAKLASSVSGPLRMALVLLVVWHAVRMVRGEEQEPIWSLVRKLMKASVIVMLVTNAGDYKTYVSTTLFTDIPAVLSEGLGFPKASATRFDGMLKASAEYTEKIYQAAGWGFPTVKALGICVLLYLVMSLLAAQGYFMFLYADFTLALLIGIGPAFICCALFDQTRKYFEGWLSQCVNYIVLKFLAFAVLSFMLATFDKLYTAPTVGSAAIAAVGIISAAFFCMGILYSLPGIAQGVAGGSTFLTQSPAAAARSIHAGSVGNAQSARAAVEGIGHRFSRARSEGVGQFFQPVSRAQGRPGTGPGNNAAESDRVSQASRRE